MSNIAKIGTVEYATLALAAAAVNDGQTVTVLRSGSAAEVPAPFTKAGSYKIIGQKDAGGAIPKLAIDMYTRPAFGKAIINLEDGSYEVGHLHLDGCAVPESNGAGIRFNPGTDTVSIHHVRLTNNENGVLGEGNTASVYISDSVFDSNGKVMNISRKGYSHNLYVGSAQRLEVTRVSFLNSVYGHDFKSRSPVNILNQVLCEGSKEGREMDLPNGGVLEANDCKFSKSADAIQNNLIDIGAEGIPAGRVEKYVYTNCHFHNDVPTVRDVQYIKSRSAVEVLLIDPLFTGAAATKDKKLTLVGNVRIQLTGGPLGPRKPAGGDPGSTSTVAVPMPAPVTPAPTPAPVTPPPVVAPVPETVPAAGDWMVRFLGLAAEAPTGVTVSVAIAGTN